MMPLSFTGEESAVCRPVRDTPSAAGDHETTSGGGEAMGGAEGEEEGRGNILHSLVILQKK